MLRPTLTNMFSIVAKTKSKILNMEPVYMFCFLKSSNVSNIQRLYSNRVTASSNVSVSDILKKWCKTFEDNSILEPKESIDFIVSHYLKTDSISVLYNRRWRHRTLTKEDIDKIEIMCRRRLENVPIQYILEEWQFRNLTLKMKPPVFIPRPETEELVQIVLNDIKMTKSTNVAELCCGSGAICLSLLKESENISVLAIDKSEVACFLTLENAKKNHILHGLTVENHELGDLSGSNEIFAGKQNYFDIIVSNPPYIPTEVIASLQPEIKFYEDRAALDGGSDGLDLIKVILRLARGILRRNGRLYLEVDPAHPEIIATLLQDDRSTSCYCDKGQYRGLALRKVHTDFAGKMRFVEIAKLT